MRAFLGLLLISTLHGQLLPGVDPRLPDTGPTGSLPRVGAAGGSAEGEGAVLMDRLSELTLLGPIDAIPSGGGPGIHWAESLLVPSPRTLEARLSRWLGLQLREGDLVAIADALLIHYDREGYPVVLVEVPDQDLSRGRLVLRVEIGRIGKVGVSRPKYGHLDAIRDGLRLKRGALLRRSALDEQLAWYGRTVFRRPRLFVSPGREAGTADLLIGLEERRPWRVTAGYDNSGPDTLGKDRFTVGAAGMLPDEQVIAWQSVIGLPASALEAHALSWEVPFHRLHQSLSVSAAYAEVKDRGYVVGPPPAVSETEGSSWSLALTQRFQLPSLGGWRQRLGLGVEAKGTDQFLLYGTAQLSPGEVRLLQARTSYQLDREWERGTAAVGLDVIASPGGLISGNDDADFRAYDSRADASYVLGRLSGSGWYSPGGDWRVALRGSGQWADSHLLPMEQFAIGGYQSVRGVGERELFADNGWFGTIELYTPELRLFERWRMRFLGFADHGWLRNEGGPSGSVSSAGIGLRVRLAPWVDLRADHGWRLDESGSRGHVGVSVTF